MGNKKGSWVGIKSRFDSNSMIDGLRNEIEVGLIRKKARSHHIQKVFGSNFKFTGEFLISDIDPHLIKNSLLKMFNLEKLTEETLKNILREGARSNNVLRLNDQWYEKMVEILNLPLDFEYTDESPNKKADTLNINQKENKEKSRLDEENNISITSTSIGSFKVNKLKEAKQELQHITHIENKMFFKDENKENVKYNENSIMPMSADSDTIADYKASKKKFKKLVQELLETRMNFSSMLQYEEPPQQMAHDMKLDSIHDLVTTSSSSQLFRFNLMVELRKPYYLLFWVIIIISVVAFAAMAFIANAYEYSDYIGPWIIVSRACASAILSTTLILMLFVSYDLMTVMRLKWRGKWLLWFNNNILIHRFWGFVITFYGTLHTIGHCLGSIKKISEEDNIEEVNKVTLHHDFATERSYLYLLFWSIPGLTGVVLLILMFLMAFTSLKWFRKKYFQVFAYIHVVSYPLFLILLIVHGSGTWFNWWFPLGSIGVTPAIVITIVQLIMRYRTIKKFKFKIADVSISENRKYIMIFFIRPEGFDVRHGQYVFLNIPQISWSQWHPFTIASSPESKFLIFMIKRAGDFTGKLIDTLFEQKKKMMRIDHLELNDHNERDVFNLLHDIYAEIRIRDMMHINKGKLPSSYI